MYHQDQSVKIQKIRAEDVAYAAFHDTVCDVQEELAKYDDAILSDVKLQTALHELDVLKSSIDTAYRVLLDAALTPLSFRLRRCKENVDTRIAELINVLSGNAVYTRHEQGSQCVTSETYDNKSGVIVASIDCDKDDILQFDEAGARGYNAPVLLLAVSILLTVVTDSKQSCPGNPDPIDDLTVAPDRDRQMEKDTIYGSTTDDVLYRDLNMTMMMIADYCDANTDDRACDCHSINGLKHRWRWKLE